MRSTSTVDVAVIGAGPAGLTAALALATLGLHVGLAAPSHGAARADTDRRTTLLLSPSIELLRNLEAWDLCAHASAPLNAIRIVDDRGGLIRAPEVLFTAAELGIACFGANVPNPALNAALDTAVSRQPRIVRVAAAAAVACDADGVRVRLEDDAALTARLAVGADGRTSLVRTAAGVPVRQWAYPQAAIAASFTHTIPHDGVSIELHRAAGPLTTVPLPGLASSLVWVETPEEAQRLAELSDDAFAARLEDRLHGTLGRIGDVSPRAVHPLSGLGAERMSSLRVALVGEAAHVLPPIGAQGLNLSLRDAATLAECVADAHRRGGDVGGSPVLSAYERARATDVLTRTLSVDLLNRSLLTQFLPFEMLRGLSLHLVAAIAPLRRLMMQTGMSSAGALPRLMQPGAPGLDVRPPGVQVRA